MKSALRLATLSYAITNVDASLLFPSGRNAGNWGPAKDVVAASPIDPVGWAPKPTAPPAAEPFDFELRRRQDETTTTIIASVATCGWPADNISAPAITCGGGGYCYEAPASFAAGCCTETNRRNCRIPTTCLESTRLGSSLTDTARTLLCDEPAQPHCVTYLYNANFFENFNGVSFLACGKEAGSSIIATSAPPNWVPPSDITTASQSTSDRSRTGTDPTNVVTVTVSPSSSPSSPDAVVTHQSSNGSSRTGAIAGGVVGGVAVLSLIAAAIFFCLRRRQRKKNEAEGKEIEGSPPFRPRDFPRNSVYGGGLPEPQYQSDFYGELPPQMAQASTQHVVGYPPPTHFEPVAMPRDNRDHRNHRDHRDQRHSQVQAIPSTFVPGPRKPSEDDIVSPITPGDQLNPADDPATYTWISNPTPPPQSDYSQFSPPPPAHFQSYRPYPGT
ncbi:uncharacterized protein F4817DRAFT_317604 [Daldinia loculata]|uniref:uncharacterized protein n=1 Tax=Daldinia loculata TaxID=103429 RepID=UPI0020C2A4B5|nr:uncharacterized protein F4817DRAFT_317604 [Daldinia loculata]KAI1645554.1 hypothetical protein F4817DRAFT_317604 [Daldinia loculata]